MTVLEWALAWPWFPSIHPGRCFASKSEVRRLVADRALTINGEKARPDDVWPEELWELVFFKGAKRQCSIWWLEPWQRGNWPPEESWEALSGAQRQWWQWRCGPMDTPSPLGWR